MSSGKRRSASYPNEGQAVPPKKEIKNPKISHLDFNPLNEKLAALENSKKALERNRYSAAWH
jgi:hypothetical protein